ncbi:cereblon family protein [Leptospira sp. SA-E8]|uniref:cereblon family protein n=1 Tax=Leptospira sp. SA-E8 TaxID=3422259 RepID=UPI003EB79962
MPDLPSSVPERESIQEKEIIPEDWKLCTSCGEKITKEEWKTSVDGAYLHNFINPLGIEFRIFTFSQAIGITWQKDSYLEDTWFPGFAWRVGSCSTCGSHLGWNFESVSGSSSFLGLILGRITS